MVKGRCLARGMASSLGGEIDGGAIFNNNSLDLDAVQISVVAAGRDDELA
jgi:hypothetical protein